MTLLAWHASCHATRPAVFSATSAALHNSPFHSQQRSQGNNTFHRTNDSAFHEVVRWHFQVCWASSQSRLQFVLFWDNVNDHKCVCIMFWKWLFGLTVRCTGYWPSCELRTLWLVEYRSVHAVHAGGGSRSTVASDGRSFQDGHLRGRSHGRNVWCGVHLHWTRSVTAPFCLSPGGRLPQRLDTVPPLTYHPSRFFFLACAGAARGSPGDPEIPNLRIFFIKDGIAVGLHSIQYTLFGSFVE